MEFKKTDPVVAQYVRQFPNYRGRKPVRIRASKSCHISDYWSEGSRTYSVFVDFKTGKALSDSEVGFQVQTIANPFSLRIGDFDLKPGIVVVENTIFCGKDLGIRVVVHPEDWLNGPRS
jgi:hypothetical protein